MCYKKIEDLYDHLYFRCPKLINTGRDGIIFYLIPGIQAVLI